MSSEMIKKRIEELKQMEAAPLPTPPVSTPVVWFAGAKRNPHRPYEDAIAGIVTKVDGPGKVTLVAFTPFGIPSHKRSSHHVDHPLHKQRNNAISVDTGSWDYPEGVKPTKGHYEVHLSEIARQIAECQANLAVNETVKAK